MYGKSDPPKEQNMKKRQGATVEVFHDPDVESPCDDEGAWQLYSFSNRHLSYRPPSEFFSDGEPIPALRNKLEAGTAWVLSYFEHGQCRWMLSDEPKGALAGDWRWDGVDMAGVLVWENPAGDLGPQTKQDRRADAAAFAETYTQWCNGETYGYTVTSPDGETVGEGWGFIGTEYLLSELLDKVDGNEVAEVRDQVAGLTMEDFQR